MSFREYATEAMQRVDHAFRHDPHPNLFDEFPYPRGRAVLERISSTRGKFIDEIDGVAVPGI